MSQSSLDSTTSTLTATPDAREILHFSYAAPSSALLALSPSSVPVGLARLPDFTFTLSPSGRANVAPVQDNSLATARDASGEAGDGPAVQQDKPADEQDGVRREQGIYGLLYLVPEDDEPRLDAAQEPYEKTIQEVELFPPPEAQTGDGPVRAQLVRALVYLDPEPSAPGAPDAEHAAAVKDAVREAVGWGMPAWYVEGVRRLIPLGEPGEGDAKGKGTEGSG